MLNRFSFNPEYPVSLYVGHVGTGKTLQTVYDGIRQADRLDWGLVANFPLNVDALANYCERYGLSNLLSSCKSNRIISIPCVDQLPDLFRYPYSVILLDEAGGRLSARDWQSPSNRFFSEALRQSRTLFVRILLTAQNPEQVDVSVRRMINQVVYFSGMTIYDKIRSIDYLIWRDAKYFEADSFWDWWANPERRLRAPAWSLLKQSSSKFGILYKKYRDVFAIYDSHGWKGSTLPRLLPPPTTHHRCDLPKHYYLSRLSRGSCPILRLSFDSPPNPRFSPLQQHTYFETDRPLLPSLLGKAESHYSAFIQQLVKNYEDSIK